MAGEDRGDYRPRRARSSDDEPTTEQTTGPTTDQTTGPTTEERVAASRRAERLAELQQLRDSTGTTPVHKADRPDVGHRRNTAEPVRRTRRGRSGPVAGIIAVVVVAAVVAGYLYWSNHRGTPAAQPQAAPSPTASINTSIVGDHTMLSPGLAKRVINQAWQIRADQPTGTGDSPVPACLAEPQDDAPTPSDAMVRTLTTSRNGPTALHLAEAYKSSELASEAFALIAKSLGECNLKGSYIASARVITGLGDQATGILLDDPQKDSHRAVLANRTGRLVNVIDIAETGSTPDLNRAAAALAQLTDQQCTLAIGICASYPQVKDGPPPVGGDEPGFLALADIPVPTSHLGTWGGLAPGSPADVVTSGCEDVEFTNLTATSRAARSYVLVDKPKGMPKTFGLDEITLTMRSDKDASREAKLIAGNIKSCSDRLPTAHVSDTAKVSGTGAEGMPISGSVAMVSQKISARNTSEYRVGIAAAGDKLVYTFLPRTKRWDLTQDQWKGLTVRAAQRATQVR